MDGQRAFLRLYPYRLPTIFAEAGVERWIAAIAGRATSASQHDVRSEAMDRQRDSLLLRPELFVHFKGIVGHGILQVLVDGLQAFPRRNEERVDILKFDLCGTIQLFLSCSLPPRQVVRRLKDGKGVALGRKGIKLQKVNRIPEELFGCKEASASLQTVYECTPEHAFTPC